MGELVTAPLLVAGRRDRALLLTFVLTGRRRAEVIGLTAGDISVEDERAFYSYRGKGGKRGRRELPRPAYEAAGTGSCDAMMTVRSAWAHPNRSWQAVMGASDRSARICDAGAAEYQDRRAAG